MTMPSLLVRLTLNLSTLAESAVDAAWPFPAHSEDALFDLPAVKKSSATKRCRSPAPALLTPTRLADAHLTTGSLEPVFAPSLSASSEPAAAFCSLEDNSLSYLVDDLVSSGCSETGPEVNAAFQQSLQRMGREVRMATKAGEYAEQANIFIGRWMLEDAMSTPMRWEEEALVSGSEDALSLSSSFSSDDSFLPSPSPSSASTIFSRPSLTRRTLSRDSLVSALSCAPPSSSPSSSKRRFFFM